jgi:SAM-dependent methyltransferase
MPTLDEDPKYDRLGGGYDQSRRADPYLVERLRFWVNPRPSGRYLDAGCGTGNYTIPLSSGGGIWSGIDHSARMLERAPAKSAAISWQRGDILRLPYVAGTFDAVVLTLVIHHLPALAQGIAEVARVLAPAGRLVMFTSTAEQMAGYWLNHYFPDAMARASAQMPTATAITGAAAAAGLAEMGCEPYAVRPDLTDGFLYKGKHEPRLYLSTEFRRGVSAFSSLADPVEVEMGCARLAADVESGAFAAVAGRYTNEGSDYVFLAYSRR